MMTGPTDTPRGLTQRELDIVRLLAQDKSPGAIQTELGISAGTFKNRIKSIRGKLQLADNAGYGQIVAKAKELKIIES